jgi:enoyl-CoA hydratase/carnithine racemase
MWNAFCYGADVHSDQLGQLKISAALRMTAALSDCLKSTIATANGMPASAD